MRPIEFLEIGIQGLPGPPGPPGQPGAAASVRTAGATLSALVGVWEDADGTVWALDAADALHINLFVGVTTTAANAGGEIHVQNSGPLNAPGLSLTPGPVWLGADGTLTQTVPASGYSLYLGAAVSPSRLVLSPAVPFQL
ncbi:MAG: hypothetical protein LBO00_07230 [Zoogloeaceae bacterium]|jgi:hypothetical protein|nr:hypothetical protein [Zoogloeaceae bacterium]